MIYKVVLVSGVPQSDSVIHLHIFIHFQILSRYRLLQNIEYSFLYHIASPCWLSILNTSVCMLIPNLQGPEGWLPWWLSQ